MLDFTSSKIINPGLVLAHARAWIGTPFVPQGDFRGAGADCVGLARGILRELSGKYLPAPAWRNDWAAVQGEPILDVLHANLVPVSAPKPGTIAVFRVGHKRAAHLGILSKRGIIHALDDHGVIEVARDGLPPLTSLWGFPVTEGCETGPDDISPNNCLVIICPCGGGYYGEITVMNDGTPLAQTGVFQSQRGAIDALSKVYPNIETVD
ncbi:hypothetical protein [Pelagimonas varians]|uniref:hypothetical protein n=1 Tax=Pelagimonas varians TaxID=696760 RepID=UPI0014738776|nr:hypothetical protein [Pelagimonas varians]